MPSLSGAAALALAATSLFASANAAIDPIVIKGSKFFYKTNGTQFYIKGVAYQQNYDKNTASSTSNVTYSDPLADASSCKRDIPYLQQLQTNTIRVYAVDPTQNHDDCMNAFADAGIYVLADLSAPVEGQSINSNDPSWDLSLYNRFTSVVDVLAKYDNTLGFLAGNEVSDMPNNTNAIAFVAAAVRDTKAYIKSKNYRSIGVGYACTDDGYGGYLETAQYLTCNNQADSIDFFGYNIYSWCGDSSYSMSHYEEHTQQFMNYPVPAFFAEYGCNNVEPRTWGDTQALYGSQMAPVWSGGIVYEYFPGGNNYQLVSVSGNSVTTLTDFSNLKSVMSTISPSGVQEGSYNPTNTGLSSCPTQNSNWTVAPSPLPPSPDAQVCSCMYQSLSCVVSPSVSQDDYSTLFGTVCGLDSSACNGIVHNGTTGKYGAYSPCNATEQLSWALNQYYLKNGQSSSACDFKGAAKVVSGSSNSQCSSITASIGSGGPTGSASGSKGAANRFAASTELGVMPAVVMIVVGVLSGVGMIAL